MRKIFMRFLVAMLTISLLIGSLAGCSLTDKLTLLDSMEKMMQMKSMEIDSDITVRIGITGISESENSEFGDFLPSNQSINMKMHQKAWGNNDGTISQAQIDAAILVEDKTTSITMWSDNDISGGTPIMRQIVKLPPEIMGFLPPEYTDRRYMVIDQKEMTESGELNVDEYKRMMEAINKFQPKLIDFMKEYAKEFSPDFAIISNKGERAIKGKDLKIYEMRLTDKSLKDFMRYTVENTSNNQNLKVFIKELIGVLTSASGGTQPGESLDEVIDEIRSNSSSFRQDIYKVLNALEKVRLLGNRGIVVNFGIDSEGYIVYQNGYADFVVDFEKIGSAFNDLQGTAEENETISPMIPNAVLNLGFDFNSNIYNINKDIIIDIPTLTAENSFSFVDLMSEFGADSILPGEEEESVGIIIDNEWSDITPLMLDDLALVPVNQISKALGAQVTQENGTVRVNKNGINIIFVEGETNVSVNGQTSEMEFPAGNMMDEYYVPLEFLVTKLGAEIHYNEVGNIVIKTK